MNRAASLAVLLALGTAPANATPPGSTRQDPAAVAAAIRAAIAAPAGTQVTLGPIQGAQFMQGCSGPLAASITGTAPYEQAAVHCAAPAWTLYVTVTVMASTPVVVAARPIAAGQTVTEDDLTLRSEPESLFAGRQIFYDPAALAGTTAVMNLPAGTILNNNDIDTPVAVQAGQTVAVDVQAGGVDVSINAIADQTGRIGDNILLTNPSSGKRFTALVTNAGLVVRLQP
jgi:flagella basal body P-ring formation protein FlgA